MDVNHITFHRDYTKNVCTDDSTWLIWCQTLFSDPSIKLEWLQKSRDFCGCICFSRSVDDYAAQALCGTHQGNELTRNSSENACPRSSQLAEVLGLILVKGMELVCTIWCALQKKKEKKKERMRGKVLPPNRHSRGKSYHHKNEVGRKGKWHWHSGKEPAKIGFIDFIILLPSISTLFFGMRQPF